MSHEIEYVNGVAQMAYAGETPWHGLGVRVSNDLSPEEMMKVAGLDWEVVKRQAYYHDMSGHMQKAKKKQALVRESDGKFLDIVSDNWIPVQNKDAFEFFSKYVETGGMEMHTAGSLKDGRIIWGLAKVNESFSLFGGKDEVESYLLLSNPHEFGRGVDIRFTPIRVVCNNTLSLSLSGKATLGISLNHRNEFDAEKVQEALKEAHGKLENYKDMAQFLAEKPYTDDTVFEYFNRVFPKTTAQTGGNFDNVVEMLKQGVEDVVSRNAKKAMEYMEVQPGAELGRGSWWQAYNTVTFMTNHVLGQNEDTRLRSAWYGVNRERNVNALGLAVEYANAA